PADCLRMIETTGVSGVTVARGAIGNPWIFQQARCLAETGQLPAPPSVLEQRAVLEEHWRLAVQLYGEERAGRLMRKFGIKYAASHPQYEEIRSGFAQVRGTEDWWQVLQRWYAVDGPGCYPPTHLHAAYGSGCADSSDSACK
ncbi:MAG: tRNA-dihydrouridine synthase family protein, partial [Planctomycetota bacterium]